jgi:hypothetical protein
MQNLKLQLHKLHLFGQYTGLQLHTTKCEATGALWAYDNPLTIKNQHTLQEQINTITFLDRSHIIYLPPNRSYKMLGVHINPVLDFRETLNKRKTPKSEITYQTTLRGPRRAKHDFSPPLSIGKVEGTAIFFSLLEISPFDMHFLFS